MGLLTHAFRGNKTGMTQNSFVQVMSVGLLTHAFRGNKTSMTQNSFVQVMSPGLLTHAFRGNKTSIAHLDIVSRFMRQQDWHDSKEFCSGTWVYAKVTVTELF